MRCEYECQLGPTAEAVAGTNPAQLGWASGPDAGDPSEEIPPQHI